MNEVKRKKQDIQCRAIVAAFDDNKLGRVDGTQPSGHRSRSRACAAGLEWNIHFPTIFFYREYNSNNLPHKYFNTSFAHEETAHQPTLSTKGNFEDIDPAKTIVPSGCQQRSAATS